MGHRLRPLVAALLTVAAMLGLAAPASAADRTDVTVMTRNLYLGGDLIPVAITPAGDPFKAAVSALVQHVRDSEPAARMKLIAGEIAKTRPAVVGLQEVSRWRTIPAGAQATDVADYLKLLTADLKRRGLKYTVATKKLGLSIRAPLAEGGEATFQIGDAMLVRGDVKISSRRSGVFTSQFAVPTQQLGPVSPQRSWNALDVTIGGAKLHVVNAHLEACDPVTRLKQAQELAAGPLKSARPTILLGDLNSGPDLEKPEDRPPYAAIAKAGFVPRRTATPSCCFGDDLISDPWDHNVDWIMVKPKGLRLLRSSVTGLEKTPGGRHPADHGGVVSTLRVTRPG
ncbi:MAG: endonuclease/exonuclease/phosphatase family protein [Solirubrobacteraceae bacterium]|nr:endonuclease/exonuclease/phosphatase family protein [Solirubrobacteraceae bacterium]